ncbi:MAG: 3-hydroxyacyl-CoA dehydrogenase NAD-binding domain-containing protein [Pseudomonadota bacterium]|jgi:3-hydroxybutyryl-CoA dehydrogenase|nr:3-hydroxyacyl-CoA dehydrogenase family protein [Desulfobacteraceae bacterium]MBU0734882.1 3-hydroxyacyl-CoA dehydrogenase family protein [Pseudomonadota bacterium]MBU0989063.1 3-hydroxyacyl-CoA dehydrogenase family protein [Pseudomonadota bacterium]
MDQEIKKVAVIGTGILGTQIAVQSAHFGYEVSAYDSDKASFGRAHEDLKSVLSKAVGKPLFTPEQWEEEARKVRLCTELADALSEADLVIEAVPEDVGIKRKVFAELDVLAPRRAILATNSSSIPISRIEGATTRPGQCLNMHFYFPAMGTSMVDVMGGTRTTPETFASGKGWVRSIGCIPLTVKKEILGFCFNRVWRAIKRETLYMWAEGFVDFRDVDRAWMIFTGMPQGPFGIMDNVGLEVVYNIEMVYYTESKDMKDHPPQALKDLIDRKELGRKTGKGFYTYPDPEYASPDFLK